MKTRIRISESEWEVMNIIWGKAPVPAGDVVEVLETKKGWRERTTRTLIDRLVKKGVLRAERDGKRYLYRPKLSREECVQKESRSFLARVFGGEPAAMLIHLVSQSKLTRKEIEELQKLLEQKRD
jgi:BlaI family transcriptional regulator, penicillinase repressor